MTTDILNLFVVLVCFCLALILAGVIEKALSKWERRRIKRDFRMWRG